MKLLTRVLKDIAIIDSATLECIEPQLSPEGYLTASVNATRPGVFVYQDEKGRELKVLRPREEVLKQESMDTLARKPATYDHPANLPTARDIDKYIVGAVGDKVEALEDFVRTTVTVHAKPAVDAVLRGNHEVSCGYQADIYQEPGISDEFGPYDLVQRNIRYNHLAVGIEKGRAGHEVRILMDSAELKPKERTVKKIKIGDKEYEVPEDLHDALTQHLAGHQSEMDKLTSTVSKLRDRLKDDGDDESGEDMEEMAGAAEDDDDGEAEPKEETKMDSLKLRTSAAKIVKGYISKLRGRMLAKAKLAKETMDSAADPSKLAEAAKSHAKLVAVGLAVIDKAVAGDLFKLSATELKKKIITAKMPKVSLEGKDQGFLDGMFEGIAAAVSPSNVGEVLGRVLMDSAEAEAGKKKIVERKSWEKAPLAHSTRSKVAA